MLLHCYGYISSNVLLRAFVTMTDIWTAVPSVWSSRRSIFSVATIDTAGALVLRTCLLSAFGTANEVLCSF